MELTGKCKKEFEKWYDSVEDFETGLPITIKGFYKLQDSFRYGVYVDFFDSVKIYLACGFDLFKYSWSIEVPNRMLYNTDKCIWCGDSTSLPKARIAEVEKANGIFNKQQP